MRVLRLVVLLTLVGCEAFNDPSDRGAADRSQVTAVEVFGARTWTAVSAGLQHTCALDNAGKAWCWGANTYLQLGEATANTCADVGTCARRPLEVSGAHVFTDIAAGATHTCALKANGEVWCWGGGLEGSGAGFLGTGAILKSVAPVKVTADSAFVAIAVGASNSCALTASGQAWCWGKNARGEVGDSSQVARTVPVPVRTDARFTGITLGNSHSCGLRDNGVVLCWGWNRFGQLGVEQVSYNNVAALELLPRRVAGTGTYAEVHAGANHTCARLTTGGIDCWGMNQDAGQLGDSLGLTHRGVPGAIASTETFTVLDVGHVSACARTTAGAARCWGGNFYGAIGNGVRSPLPEQAPVAMAGSVVSFTRFSGGGYHMCGLDAAGKLYCWGDKAYGQIGN